MLSRAVLEWMSDNSKVVQNMMYSRNPSSKSTVCECRILAQQWDCWPLMARQMQQIK